MFETFDQIFSKVPEHFIPENAEGAEARIQIEMQGEKGGLWFVSIRDQVLEMGEGLIDSPDLSFTGDARICLEIANGSTNPFTAYIRGAFSFSGDSARLYQLQHLFHLPDELAWIRRLA